MKVKEDIGTRWAAYFGGITVVASLLLVAWEIRQNTSALSAQAIQDLNAMANEILITPAANDQLAMVLVKGDRDLESLSEPEYRQYYAYSYAIINALDAAYGFYVKGLVDEADYSGWGYYTCRYLEEPSVNTIWNADKETFGYEFGLFVDEKCEL